MVENQDVRANARQSVAKLLDNDGKDKRIYFGDHDSDDRIEEDPLGASVQFISSTGPVYPVTSESHSTTDATATSRIHLSTLSLGHRQLKPS